MNKNYVAPNMPVEELPEEYHYLRDLTEKEANDTGWAVQSMLIRKMKIWAKFIFIKNAERLLMNTQ